MKIDCEVSSAIEKTDLVMLRWGVKSGNSVGGRGIPSLYSLSLCLYSARIDSRENSLDISLAKFAMDAKINWLRFAQWDPNLGDKFYYEFYFQLFVLVWVGLRAHSKLELAINFFVHSRHLIASAWELWTIWRPKQIWLAIVPFVTGVILLRYFCQTNAAHGGLFFFILAMLFASLGINMALTNGHYFVRVAEIVFVCVMVQMRRWRESIPVAIFALVIEVAKRRKSRQLQILRKASILQSSWIDKITLKPAKLCVPVILSLAYISGPSALAAMILVMAFIYLENIEEV